MMKRTARSMVFAGIILFLAQRGAAQESAEPETLSDLAAGYIAMLDEKGVVAETDVGKGAAPGVITDGGNFMYLPQGITIFLPVMEGAEALIAAIANGENIEVLGSMEWIISHDPEKKLVIFRDSGK